MIKIYNKDSKLNINIQDTDLSKIVNIHKYDKEIECIHSFTYLKKNKEIYRPIKVGDKYIETKVILNQNISNNIAYYSFLKILNNTMIERMWISDDELEHWKVVGYMEEIKTRKIFKSGNIYEQREKMVNEDVYMSEFKNGKLSDLNFKIDEIKINEYLKKTNL